MGGNGGTKHNIKGNALLPLFALIMAVAALAVTAWIMVVKPGRGGIALANSSPSSALSQAQSQTQSGQSSVFSSAPVASVQSGVSQAAIDSSSIQDVSYFDNALFIGDSITDGIKQYKLLDKANVIATNSMSIGTAAKSKVKVDGESVSLLSAAANYKPSKIYILLGSNDVSWMTKTTFVKDYTALLDTLKKSCPGAAIYVQSVFPVSSSLVSKKHSYSNDKIAEINTSLKQMCQTEGAKYEDVASVLKASDGSLKSELSSDGLNIRRKGYIIWLNYLIANK